MTTIRRRRLVGGASIALAAVLALGVAPVAAQDQSVDIVDFAFEPAEVTVQVGDSVTWTNTGEAPHTATADDESFDTGTLNPGESDTVTFDTAGSYAYFCAIHPNMTGTVVVEEAAAAPTEDAATEEATDAAATEEATDDAGAESPAGDEETAGAEVTQPATDAVDSGGPSTTAVLAAIVVALAAAAAGFALYGRIVAGRSR